MDERFTIQDLTNFLVEKHGMDKKDAEVFVKEFFLLIEQALEKEKYVKIKGLGTFKLVDIESRESVDVNTGERIEIAGHARVSFTPESNLKELINRPFSHFETVVLNENALLDDVSSEVLEDDGDEDADGYSTRLDETSNEVPEEKVEKGLVGAEIPLECQQEESADLNNNQIEDQKEVAEEGFVVDENSLECQQEEPSNLNKNQTEDQREVLEEGLEESLNSRTALTAEEIIALELQNSGNLSELNETEGYKKEKSSVFYLITIITIVLLLCGSAVVFIYYPDLFSSSQYNQEHSKKNQTEVHNPSLVTDSLLDSVSVSRQSIEKDTAKVQEDVDGGIKEENPTRSTVLHESKKEAALSQPANRVYSDSIAYVITGTQQTYTIKEGETLTKVSLRFYGTKGLWGYLVKHNKDVIKNPNNVPYGTTIKIPQLDKK